MASTAPKQAKSAPKTPPKQQPANDAAEAVAPAKKKRSLPKILLLLTLLLGIAGGAAWYFFHDDDEAAVIKPAVGRTAVSASAAKTADLKPPVFLPLEPFTVNLQHDDVSPQYLQVGLSLKLTDAALLDKVKLHMPEIRNRVLLLLSAKKASELTTTEGKKTLSTELAREISQPLAGSVPAQALDSVLFTSFVIQ